MAKAPLITRDSGILILVMGQTGAGKSHFINVAAGESIAPVHDNLTSTSLDVQHYIVQSTRGHPVVLVDTPGFNHITEPDNAVLGRITQWLKKSCELDVSFGGVIYLHDITQDRCSKKPWPVGYFSSPEPARHLLLTTAKWDRVQSGMDCSEREDELKRSTWRRLITGSASTCRFQNTKASAWDAINTLLELEPLELHDMNGELDRIRAGSHGKRKTGLFAKLFNFWWH